MPLRTHVKSYINHTQQQHKSLFAFLYSSSATVNPINLSPVIANHHTVLFVAMKKSMETFDGLDHQYTPEENLYQIDALISISTNGKQSLDPIAFIQW